MTLKSIKISSTLDDWNDTPIFESRDHGLQRPSVKITNWILPNIILYENIKIF